MRKKIKDIVKIAESIKSKDINEYYFFVKQHMYELRGQINKLYFTYHNIVNDPIIYTLLNDIKNNVPEECVGVLSEEVKSNFDNIKKAKAVLEKYYDEYRLFIMLLESCPTCLERTRINHWFSLEIDEKPKIYKDPMVAYSVSDNYEITWYIREYSSSYDNSRLVYDPYRDYFHSYDINSPTVGHNVLIKMMRSGIITDKIYLHEHNVKTIYHILVTKNEVRCFAYLYDDSEILIIIDPIDYKIIKIYTNIDLTYFKTVLG